MLKQRRDFPPGPGPLRGGRLGEDVEEADGRAPPGEGEAAPEANGPGREAAVFDLEEEDEKPQAVDEEAAARLKERLLEQKKAAAEARGSDGRAGRGPVKRRTSGTKKKKIRKRRRKKRPAERRRRRIAIAVPGAIQGRLAAATARAQMAMMEDRPGREAMETGSGGWKSQGQGKEPHQGGGWKGQGHGTEPHQGGASGRGQPELEKMRGPFGSVPAFTIASLREDGSPQDRVQCPICWLAKPRSTFHLHLDNSSKCAEWRAKLSGTTLEKPHKCQCATVAMQYPRQGPARVDVLETATARTLGHKGKPPALPPTAPARSVHGGEKCRGRSVHGGEKRRARSRSVHAGGKHRASSVHGRKRDEEESDARITPPPALRQKSGRR